MQYLQKLVQRETKAVTRTKTVGESRRKYTFKYFLENECQDLHQVCLDMFLKTLGIFERKLKTVRSRKYNSELSYDESIRHGNAKKAPNNKLSDDVTIGIWEHIKLFPTVPSHYC